jgi:hypothetical protein
MEATRAGSAFIKRTIQQIALPTCYFGFVKLSAAVRLRHLEHVKDPNGGRFLIGTEIRGIVDLVEQLRCDATGRESVDAESRYDSLLQYYAERYGQDWLLLKAQVKQESAFDPDALNPRSGAQGLAQFMAATFKEWQDGSAGIGEPPPAGILSDRLDPEDAIHAQAAYMAWLHRVTKSTEQALAAYNYGIGNLRRAIEQHGGDWKTWLPPETKQYITKVIGYWNEYRAQAQRV